MMRTPPSANGEGKGKQRAEDNGQDPLASAKGPSLGSSFAARPAMLSPSTARPGDAHTRSSRFLRKSRSKQLLKETDVQTSSGYDDGSETSTLALHDPGVYAANGALSADPPLAAPASPDQRQQASRSSTISSPLSRRSGNRQLATPQKGPVDEGSRSMGGWFSGIISSSPSGQRKSGSNNDDAASIRSFATVAASPSRLLQRKVARDSPHRRSAFVHSNVPTDTGSGSASAAQPTARPAIPKMGGFDRMFDRAVQFFTDADSNADRCPADIWLLGVRHIGWRPAQDQPLLSPDHSTAARPSMDTISSESYFHVTDSPSSLPKPPTTRHLATSAHRRLSKSSSRTVSSMGAASPSNVELPPSPPPKSTRLFTARKGASSESSVSASFLERTTSGSSSASSVSRSEKGNSRSTSAWDVRIESVNGLPPRSEEGQDPPSEYIQSATGSITSHQSHGWPPAFYHDFYSRLQLTYRSGFVPLPAASSAGTVSSVANAFSSMMTNLNASIGRSMSAASLGDTQLANGLSSDAGWGCMLRTGQSLLGNALVAVHLGRSFRRPLLQATAEDDGQSSFKSCSAYPRYVRLISWFFDDPSPLSPFSIHKFAAEGKKLGKQIGEWFGPSTAAGAIKVLTNAFAPANLGVALAIDTTLYASEVFHVAKADGAQGWNRPVLILVPLRLGLNGVNPIYYNSLRHYFALPQCVGIAGGRPSSSYYFVGVQDNQLFYIDPHHTKPSVKAVSIPEDLQRRALQEPLTSANLPTPSSYQQAELGQLDQFFASSYSPKDLESFHCEKVRKMSLSALDPSMLVGLLCQSRSDWDDLCRRMKEFPSSKDHHPIINIVQEMPAWMRKSSRTISGAGLNASTTSETNPTPTRMEASMRTSPRGSAGILSADDFEGSSVDYADSDDWDIDDSDDEGNDVKSEASGAEENNADVSIMIEPSSSPSQEMVPGSFESDEPDYRASKNGTFALAMKQDFAVAGTGRDISPPSLDNDFERISVITKREMSSSPTDSEPVVIPPIPPKSPVPVEQGYTALQEGEAEDSDADTGWQTLTGRCV